MQTRSVRFSALLTLCAAFGITTLQAQLPANFPTVTVLTNYAPAVANGYIFQGNNFGATNVGYYAMILTNDGTPIWYKELTNACYDFKVLPNGYLHYAQQIKALTYTGGGHVIHDILDDSYNPVETIQAGNGYVAEAHDFQMLPNGHVLVLGYYLSEVDMSQVVPNGNPAALVSGAIIQELDAQRNVVFQWRSWDHYPFSSQWVNSTNAVISAFHVNCVFQDDDGHLMISTPDWVKKINRQTGEILWHLGGTENQFTFVGVTSQQGTNDFRSHAINRLANGHVLLYNNSAFASGTTSSVHEYALDETNKIATHIWTYKPSPNVPGPFQGNAERLANGNSFVGWGGLPNVTPYACTEVADTNVVFQMKFNNPNVICYRAYRFPYPPQSQANEASVTEVASGNSYTLGDTGVSLQLLSGGGGYNRVSVSREPYAPVYPLFQGKAPRVLPVRVKLSEIAVDTMTVNLDFNATSFGFANPNNLTVWYRTQSGKGLFLPQVTTYNQAISTLRVNLNLSAQGGDLGEFIFCYPDIADVAFPPMLGQVENYRGVQPYDVIAPRLAVPGIINAVNQERPILLSWSPKGLAESYEFQVATNQDFSGQVFQVPYQTDAFYVWNGAGPNTTYYYRVRTWNEAGASDWASGSFRTVAPVLTLTTPNGGEMWRSGLSYFIQWNANIAENVILELYKGGILVATISSNTASSGAYLWQVSSALNPGSDYSIKIRSTTNSALTDVGDAYFSINMPFVNAQSLARLSDGSFSFAFTAPGATEATVQATMDFKGWQDLQTLPLTNGSAVFVDNTATNLPLRFYRVKIP
ncbi:MAG TPA: aryl-sulfate sulfotransferase [Candidatus Limnocylindrales bacterium]|nr:aryl-sulfate sulfotransferase [Candidatus Limnocylindrales bacterium]